MKIQEIELYLVKMPLIHFFETSFGRETEREFILIRIAGNGIEGWGEVVANKLPLYSYETNKTAWHVLKDIFIPLIFKKSIKSPEEFNSEISRFKGHNMAKAGLELALWDLHAKEKGLPLWKLHGGVKNEIPSGVSVGIQDSVSQLLSRIENFLKLGYKRIKLKIKPAWDLDILKEVRKSFPNIPLSVDANGAYSLKDKEHLKRLDDFNLMMIEQPFPAPSFWDHAQLQKELRTPICLDESIASYQDAEQAFKIGSYRIINIKVGRVGGVIEAKKIHDFCMKNSIPVWCGGMLESGIGRAHNIHLASLPNFKLPNDISASKRYYSQDIIEPEIELTNKGTIKVPQNPGIGVLPLKEKINKIIIHKEIFKPD
ncbi:o-succinylbenzoate synthase [Candidatus Aminicenantes bacterium AC-708-M15]|jgi:O-succinylbenzoate synthase|nr:o-succinylbenzoate synthase [SCandidatus Aminicenantes bacterium Aminicenantia_JdfR_composite]MCP2596806.1 o-succinylbenzoate synthase [Candidatus Aminicenantes bacterium AC-335-G13]MCP2598267.1 o-succinylbenzoate synthase [Candidatus Aminicenantes bacterium AC-335-L06]MCP2604006.1 o-succinylbenzoate synthase [Candidatus Aminicenantes bacterium AC-708-M15]MCP2618501.1 o-succinylbenzoate synthase [Candidatus Aminicenantes bacterium AC-335-A11]